MNAQIKEIEARIDVLKAKAEKANAESRLQYSESLEILESKKRALESKFQKIKNAGENSWYEFKTGVERAWTELKMAADRALKELK